MRLYGNNDISTLAPREGSDGLRQLRAGVEPYFYPRSPRGERPPLVYMATYSKAFLPSLPARGATTSPVP